MDGYATDFGNAVQRESLNSLLKRADASLKLMALCFATPEQCLGVEQLPSGVLFLCLAMSQKCLGPLEALRESQTLALGVIEPLAEMHFAVLLLGDHAVGVGKLCFERSLSVGWGWFWGF